MRLVHLLPERWQKFLREALKFGIVGGANTVVNYTVFNVLALTVFANGQLKATVIATLVSAVTSYLMNRHWTYRDRSKSMLHREYALFFLFNATGLLIELGVLALAKYELGVTGLLGLNVAKTGGVVLGTIFRFWSYRSFVFQPTALPASDEPDRHVSAELDPVAELAEAMTELEKSDHAAEGATDGLREPGTSPAHRSGFGGSVDTSVGPDWHAAVPRPTHR